MAPKLDKVMGDEYQLGAKSTDTALASLQALTLDAVGPLTDLLERRWQLVGSPQRIR